MKGGTEQPTRGQRNAKGQRDGESHNGEDGETLRNTNRGSYRAGAHLKIP